MSRPDFTVITNPNKEEFQMVSDAVRANGNYCCCATEKTADTMCMCKEFRESQETGFCHCRRFYKVRNSEVLGLLVDITDDEGADAFQKWYGRLSQEDFIVIPILYNAYDVSHASQQHHDISKTAISKCDAIFVVDTEYENEYFMESMTEWAQDLGKKIIYRSILKNEN
jgi:hypothetical protein